MKSNEILEIYDKLCKSKTAHANRIIKSKMDIEVFCKKNNIDSNKLVIKMPNFDKSSYAAELEKYPLLRDNFD